MQIKHIEISDLNERPMRISIIRIILSIVRNSLSWTIYNKHDMKLIKRIICIFKGHDWLPVVDKSTIRFIGLRCKRCGKFKPPVVTIDRSGPIPPPPKRR